MIPRNELEREILERLQNLEKKSFNGETYETNYGKLSPREQSKRISDGVDPNHHIGKKTKEVLLQEAISLYNSINPQTTSWDEATQWDKAHNQLWNEIDKLSQSDKNFVMKRLGQFHEKVSAIEKILHPV